MDFEAAATLVKSAPDLPFGKITVMVSIAAAQIHGGMGAGGRASLRLGLELAQDMPERPGPKGVYRTLPRGFHYRNEAYRIILLGAAQAHELGTAREVAELWKAQGGYGADDGIISAWLGADQADEAAAFARKFADSAARAKALLNIAEDLLNTAGAPIF